MVMKNDLNFGVKTLVAALVLVSCITFFALSFECAPIGVLLLSTSLLAFPITYLRVLWERAK
jgi:hypothetical protein